MVALTNRARFQRRGCTSRTRAPTRASSGSGGPGGPHGLVRESRGLDVVQTNIHHHPRDGRAGAATTLAHDLIRRAAQDRHLNLPLFRAHILVDHGELCGRAQQTEAATLALREAERIYRDLGAHHYLRRMAGGWPRVAAPARSSGPAISVSDRERDVLALLVNGMSYAQIAAELFITQKTVGYHLSNLYAKAHVTGRHELAELARREAEMFKLDLLDAAS